MSVPPEVAQNWLEQMLRDEKIKVLREVREMVMEVMVIYEADKHPLIARIDAMIAKEGR
jgi:hypothetical protein